MKDKRGLSQASKPISSNIIQRNMKKQNERRSVKKLKDKKSICEAILPNSNWIKRKDHLSKKIARGLKKTGLEKEKHHTISLICEILKNDTNELICKTEIDSQT